MLVPCNVPGSILSPINLSENLNGVTLTLTIIIEST
jgi:hypothetical protein